MSNELQDTPLNKEYTQSQKLLSEIRQQLIKLEEEQDTTDLETHTKGNINKLIHYEQKLKEQLLEVPLSQRGSWRKQIDQISDERVNLRQSFDKIIKRKTQERERMELMGGTDKSSLEDLSKYQHLQTQNQSLKQSNTVAERIKEVGIGLLGALGEQRETLKGAQQKILDIGVSLGVSHSTMKMAQRRDYCDRIIAIIGMLFIVLLLIVVWYYKFYKS